MEFSPFLKQVFVGSAPLLTSISLGGAVSYPTVLLHQLKRNDTTIPLDFDTASWIGSIHGFAGIPSILMPAFMQWKGRKIALIIACLVSILGWVLAYCANSASVLLASESVQGFGSNCIFTAVYLSISEMMPPAYREPFIQMYLIVEVSSMTLNGLMTQFLHWKTISIIMCMPMVLALIIACMWPESPYWLAYKGEFEKCQNAFTWLRGTDESSNKELKELMHAQKKNIVNEKLSDDDNAFMRFLNKVKSRDFYVPATHMFIIQYLVYGIGNIVIIIYSIELFQKATGDENIAFYGGFIVNGIFFVAFFFTMVINRYLKKKFILLISTAAASTSLTCASLVFYLESSGFIEKESLISLYFIIAYIISISFGITTFAYSIASELMPVRHRSLGGALYVANTCVFHTVSLKLAPYLFLLIDLHGTFLLYAFNGVVFGLLVWKYIPDTQGKTLQQIEDYYKHGKFYHNTPCSETDMENMLKSGE